MSEQAGTKNLARAVGIYERLQRALLSGQVTFEEISSSGRPAIEFFSSLLQCAIRSGKHQFTLTIVDDMTKLCVKRPLGFYEGTMKQLAGHKQYHIALRVYDRLAADGLEPSAVTFSCLVGFAAEVNEGQRAIEFFERLCKVTTPSIRACMIVLRVHGRRQDWDSSLAALRQMQSLGVSVDGLALNIVLATGVAADKLEAVQELIAESRTYSTPIADVVSYNTLIKGCAQRGYAKMAMQAVKDMQRYGLKPNAITFNTCMDAAVRGSRLDLAWDTVDSMRKCNLRPDKFSCSILVKGLAKEPRIKYLKASLDLLLEVDSMCDTSLKSSMFHQVLTAAIDLQSMCAKTSSADEAQALPAKVYAQMRQQNVQASSSAQRLVIENLAGVAAGTQ